MVGGRRRITSKALPRKQRAKKQRAQRQGRVVTAPIAKSYISTTRGRDSDTFSGNDFVENIQVSGATADGQLLAEVPIGPQWWEGRAASLASIYSNWQLVSCAIELMTHTPTTTGGGYIHGVDGDLNEPANGITKSYMADLNNSVSASWWKPTTTVFKQKDKQVLRTDQDAVTEPYKTTAGVYRLLVDGAPSNITGSLTMTIRIRWTIKFSMARGPSHGLAPNTGYRLEAGETWALGGVANTVWANGAVDVTADGTTGGIGAWWNASGWGQIWEFVPEDIGPPVLDSELPAFVVALKYSSSSASTVYKGAAFFATFEAAQFFINTYFSSLQTWPQKQEIVGGVQWLNEDTTFTLGSTGIMLLTWAHPSSSLQVGRATRPIRHPAMRLLEKQLQGSQVSSTTSRNRGQLQGNA